MAYVTCMLEKRIWGKWSWIHREDRKRKEENYNNNNKNPHNWWISWWYVPVHAYAETYRGFRIENLQQPWSPFWRGDLKVIDDRDDDHTAPHPPLILPLKSRLYRDHRKVTQQSITTTVPVRGHRSRGSRMWAETTKRKPFLMSQVVTEGKILVFSAEEKLEKLSQSLHGCAVCCCSFFCHGP